MCTCECMYVHVVYLCMCIVARGQQQVCSSTVSHYVCVAVVLCSFALKQGLPQNLEFKDRLDSLVNEFNRFPFICLSGNVL